MVKDPVCGMTVDPEEASAVAEHEGETYYFCCSGCKAAFETEPEGYLDIHASSEGHHTSH